MNTTPRAVSSTIASVVADRRAVAAVTVLGMATFVGFLADRFGDLTGAADGWAYGVVIGFASALGIGYRAMRSVGQPTRVEPDAGSEFPPFIAGPGPVGSPPDTAPGGSRGA